MHSQFFRPKRNLFFALAIATGVAWNAASTASADQSAPVISPPPGVVNVTPPPPVQPKPLDLLHWDTVFQEQSPQLGQPTADFVFGVANPSDVNVVIDRVQTSCGCTVAKLPSTPWVLAPHTNGEISVSVNLAGKAGTFFKTITVISSNANKILTIKVNMPENPQIARMRNQQMAMADPQAVFKGDCAKCHVDKAKGLMGKQLYAEACGICHDANPRATMVTDLHHLKHPTSYSFWKQIITDGKPKTMMPAFGAQHGGPLSDKQIKSLAKVLMATFPPDLTSASAQSSAPPRATGYIPPLPVRN